MGDENSSGNLLISDKTVQNVVILRKDLFQNKAKRQMLIKHSEYKEQNTKNANINKKDQINDSLLTVTKASKCLIQLKVLIKNYILISC